MIEMVLSITKDERQRRSGAVDYAIASVGLSGVKIPDAGKIRAQCFIDAKNELEELVSIKPANAVAKD